MISRISARGLGRSAQGLPQGLASSQTAQEEAQCSPDSQRRISDLVQVGVPPTVRPAWLDSAVEYLPRTSQGWMLAAASTTTMLLASRLDNVQKLADKAYLAVGAGAVAGAAVGGVKFVQNLIVSQRNGLQYVELLELYQEYFTRASRTCLEHRNEQQAIAHYWHHAGGDVDSWIEAAYCLNPIILSTVARTLRRIRTDRLSHPSMLAKVRWFVEAILQPASSFTPDDDGRRAAAKLVKMRILAVHPDKFLSRAQNADRFCLKNTRTLLELVSEVQEWIRDPDLALLMLGAASEDKEGL